MDQTNNELYLAEDVISVPQKYRRSGKGRVALSIISIVWNGLLSAFSAVRLVFLPLSFLVSLGISVIGTLGVFLYSLVLAMTVLAAPWIPLGVVLIVPVILLGAVVLELIPVGLGVVGLILSILSVAGRKKKFANSDRSTLRTISLVLGIVSFVLSVISVVGGMVCSFLVTFPLLVLDFLCVFFFIQMIVIAIQNSMV